MKKSFYVVIVSRDEDGSLRKVPVPLHFAYVFAAAAIIGLFTVAGLAGSYSRMLLKTERFNQLRREHDSLQSSYASLQKREHEKEIQAASLGALAQEVSALYGLTASKLGSGALGRHLGKPTVVQAAEIVPSMSENASFSNANYAKSVSDFYSLRASAMSGSVTQTLSRETGIPAMRSFEFLSNDGLSVNAPTLWPVLGSITSSFGQREDPILGNGEGEFHKGLDISASYGTPIRATADGTVHFAGFGNGYGREVVLEHGGGVETIYGHMSGFHVSTGDQVVRGQVIGYVGSSGRSTGAHVHYEVRLRGVAVNPHKYLRSTDFSSGVQVAQR